MGSGFAKMKKQARMLEQQMDKMRAERKNTEATGTAGNGLVSVVLNGEKEMKSIQIQPECLADVEALQDLIQAAHTDALRRIEESAPSVLPM